MESGDLRGENRLSPTQLMKPHIQSHRCRCGCQRAESRDPGASVLSQIPAVVLYQGPRTFSPTARDLAIAGTHSQSHHLCRPVIQNQITGSTPGHVTESNSPSARRNLTLPGSQGGGMHMKPQPTGTLVCGVPVTNLQAPSRSGYQI